MTTEQELIDALSKYPNEKAYKCLAGANLTLPQFMSANRLNMYTAHLEQFVPVLNPESPNMPTSFEKPYGKYTDSYSTAEADFRIIAVIPKFVRAARFNYLYVVQNLVTKVFDVIEIKHYEALSEERGYLRPYTKADAHQPGDIIHKGETLFRSNSHDEYGNYRYGLNPKVAYISLPETEEDAIVIREGYREKFSYYDIEEVTCILNKNHILLDLYGNDQVGYKCFPDLGCEVKNGMVFARRTINYANIDSNVTTNALRHIVFNDEVCHGDGQVIDIDIWVNDREEFEDSENKSQIREYYQELLAYYQKVYDTLAPIVNSRNDLHIQHTYRLQWQYEHARNCLDPNAQGTDNANTFEFARIKLTLCHKKCVLDGNKITDRFGGKGVISHVWPDEYMPRDKFGNVADLILSPPSTIARANPGQNYEQEYNFIADCVTKRMLKMPIEQRTQVLIDFISTVNPKEGEQLVKYISRANPTQIANMWKDIEQYGLYLVEEPFGGTISLDNIEFLYNKYKIAPSTIKICREFLNKTTALSLKNRGNVMRVTKGSVEYLIPKEINTRQIDENASSHGVTPFDIDKDEKYGNSMGGKAIVPFTDNNGETDYETVDLMHYQSQTGNDENGNLVNAWINEDGLLVRQYESMNEVVIGRKYYLLLKQMPDEKFSARSLGSTNQIGIPNKSGKQSKQFSPYSKSAIKYSEMDSDVNFTRIDSEIQNRFLATHSTNPKLIEDLGAMLLTEDPLELHDLPIKSEDIADNAPALVMHANLYAGAGLKIDPIYEGEEDK